MNLVVYARKAVKEICSMNTGDVFLYDGNYWMLTDSEEGIFRYAVNLKDGRMEEFGQNAECEVCAGNIVISTGIN